MNHDPQSWRPASFQQAVDDVKNLDIRETHFLELKRQFEATPKGKASLYKALASRANHGGTLVIGVGKDKEQDKATAVEPAPLVGQVERVMQAAANLDHRWPCPVPSGSVALTGSVALSDPK